jgi:hypothetical protein
MLLELDPEVYKDFIVYEGEHKVIYVRILKALYGMIKSALLFYKKFKDNLEGIGFKVNNYDPCVANRMIKGNQQTVTWHANGVKSSHIDPKVNDALYKWLESNYGDPKIAKVKATRGKIYEYLGLRLDYSKPGI